MSRIGYCEYNCTLCGQVCPTGAIKRLPVEEKRKVKLGLAEVDRSHCLPWKGDSDCIVCEEHCPTPEARRSGFRRRRCSPCRARSKMFKRPYVDEKPLRGVRDMRDEMPADRPRGYKGDLARTVEGKQTGTLINS